MKFFLILLSFLTLLSANSDVVGEVLLVDGNVKIKSKGSIRKKKALVGASIYAGDLVSSSKNSHLKLRLEDNSTLILDELSTLRFNSVKNTEQISGKVLYKITSRDAKNSLKVKTPFAVIGIKGTTFIVNAQKKEESIALKEGLIGVSSIKEEFSLYRKEVLAAFNNFKEEQAKALQESTERQMSEFERYKSGITQEDTKVIKPIITKEFDLKAGNAISFNKNIVKESSLETLKEDPFKKFNNFFSKPEEEK